MGLNTDAEELMDKAVVAIKAEKRKKFVWAVATSLGTIITTTATVSVTLNNYLHKAERENEKLRDSIAIMDKKLEKLELTLEKGLKDAQVEAYEARATANKALLYAQLQRREVP